MQYNALGIWFASNNPDELNTRSFSNMVLKLMPAGAAPIYALIGDRNRTKALQVQHGYFTKTYMIPHVQVDGLTLAAATTIPVDDSSGIVPGMVLHVHATRENMLVTAVPTSTSLTVTRGYGEVLAADIPDDSYAQYVGTSYEQASQRPTSLSVPAVYVSNYTQIFRNSWALSRTARNSLTETRNWDNVAESKWDAATFHSQGMEFALLFGQAVAPTGSPPRHATRGTIQAIENQAPGNVFTAAATTSFEDLETYFEPLFDYNTNEGSGSTRAAFTDRLGARVMSGIGRQENNLSTSNRGETVFGQVYNKMVFDSGEVMWRSHPLLNRMTTNTSERGVMYTLDLPSVKIAYLGDADVIREDYYGTRDSHNNGEDAVAGGMTSEFAVEFKNPLGSGIVRGLLAAA